MATYVYCPVCGSRLTHHMRSGRDRAACEVCGWVHYVNPVPGVGILIEMDGGVVLICRSNPPHRGRWALPSGYVELDETVEEGAVREAREETGLEVALIELAAVRSFPEGPPQSGIMLFYRAQPIGGRLEAGDDAGDARVFQPDELPLLPFRTHREMLSLWQLQRGGSSAFHVRRATEADELQMMSLLAMLPAYRSLSREGRREQAQQLREAVSLEILVAVAEQSPPILVGVLIQDRALGVIREWSVLPTFQPFGVEAALLAAADEA